jgi:ribosomal protein S18 acetylase RimI-like enzyme
MNLVIEPINEEDIENISQQIGDSINSVNLLIKHSNCRKLSKDNELVGIVSMWYNPIFADNYIDLEGKIVKYSYKTNGELDQEDMYTLMEYLDDYSHQLGSDYLVSVIEKNSIDLYHSLGFSVMKNKDGSPTRLIGLEHNLQIDKTSDKYSPIKIHKFDKKYNNEIIGLVREYYPARFGEIEFLVASTLEMGYGYVCEDKNKIIGFCIYTLPENNLAHLREILVHNEYRSRGIGGLLMVHSIEHSKKINVNKIIVNSRDYAINFYKKFGFVDSNKESYYVYKSIKNMGK